MTVSILSQVPNFGGHAGRLTVQVVLAADAYATGGYTVDLTGARGNFVWGDVVDAAVGISSLGHGLYITKSATTPWRWTVKLFNGLTEIANATAITGTLKFNVDVMRQVI